MNAAEVQSPTTQPARRSTLPRRFITTIIAVALVGLMVRQVSVALEQNPRPAGFLRGMLQGAMMPVALPNLLVGNDVTIYAAHNNGVPYKLGYTVGVNLCGAFFFGMFFLRITRWRQRRNGANRSGPPTQP